MDTFNEGKKKLDEEYKQLEEEYKQMVDNHLKKVEINRQKRIKLLENLIAETPEMN